MTINLNPSQRRDMLNPSVVSSQNDEGFQVGAIRDLESGAIDSVVAVFADHQTAEASIKRLAEDGFEMKHLSVIGKGYHSEEKVVGFYNAGDRIKFWGTRGAFWGGLWGLFFGGLFMTTPIMGPVIVLGYLAVIIISGVESAIVVGGISALGAALCSIGIPKDSVIQYEADVKADHFIVMVHGSTDEIDRAKAILGTIGPSRLDVHLDTNKTEVTPKYSAQVSV